MNAPPAAVSAIKWRFTLHKQLFDTGYGLTNYFKYLIALFGISSLNVGKTLFLAILYAMFCYVVGFIWYFFGFVEVNAEVSNRFNLFTKEMRDMKKTICETEKNKA